MAAYNKFNSFAQRLTDKGISLVVDVFKVMLTNTLPLATNAVKTDITEIAAGNGYAAGGATTTIAETAAAGVVTEKGSVVTITSVTGNLGPFRYAVLYDSTTNDLVAWFDYGVAVTLNGVNGDSTTITFDPVNGIFQLS